MPSINTFANIESKANWVAMKGLALLKNSLAGSRYFSSEYSGDYAQKFAIGRTMSVPLSQRYTVKRNDLTYTPQALDRPITTLSIDQTGTVPLEWESIEKALDMERGEERVESIYLRPAIAQIVTCYKKVCAEYQDGTKICELTPVDCSHVKMQ